ncbi:GNAT family N-acetyltransferase [Bradyrhizobium diazoefficiens]|jgi:GNAT superfamily N-acetyltransferase|nr:GNAT family N-acetyltransferase [Bradyrhizobium diazoefficiens]UCF52950.1 MAG: GNAT family N-acetyltransferase [Bradyrhizobium sp.]MBR0962977.1 GNAT family N-acetyltransferase [Bradyrhizobium diazoefficiens]MBR0977137.1 GNAT family N-acetyltransferase [Bradyrhizobium diazoefficiens]MBR1005782.1 GNAT family N-acetyltransferase [Bradyrhizobium diazoefficiens]MBR1012255.1 GNAT family N-acetyltransferase [Bradyrhizobium diazoefficiens]
MGATDGPTVIKLGLEDAIAGLALSTEAHWNQTKEDWRVFLHDGVVFGIRDGARLVATAALLPYSGDNAWISMVLVTGTHRRRGLATRLVDACLATARQNGLTSWLDATPDGATVYGPLGFTPTLQLRRLKLVSPPRETSGSPAVASLDALRARDLRATGFDRTALLTAFAQRSGSRIVAADGSIALVRDGRTARHIGPLFADNAVEALALVHAIAQSETRPLLIDAVASQATFLEGLTASGWTIERPFQRMRCGPDTTAGEDMPFAVAGPEFG